MGAAAEAQPADVPIAESRWPPVAALLVYMALNIGVRIWLPGDSPVRVPWLIPAVEAVLLAVLVFGHPARMTTERRQRVRPFLIGLVVLLVAAALWATALLVYT